MVDGKGEGRVPDGGVETCDARDGGGYGRSEEIRRCVGTDQLAGGRHGGRGVDPLLPHQLNLSKFT